MHRSSWVSVFLIVASIAVLAWRGWQYEEYVALEIMAPESEDAKIPVYAQFVITQTAVVSTDAEVVDVDVPMDVPDAGLPFAVRWTRDGDLLTVTVDGSEIAHEQKDRAPRVYVEKDDLAYPDGNYWIAENEKAGDMAMKVVARRRIYERIWGEWSDDPLDGVQQVGWTVLGLMVLGALPGLVQRINKRAFV